MGKVAGLLRLARPANVVTAVADVLAGAAIAGFAAWQADASSVVLLCLSTLGLYAGGVVFNDVFDARLDAVERPERPIPSGLVSPALATSWGALLLAVGIFSASRLGSTSVALAALIAFFSLVYDKWGKHHRVLGPVNMGLCRGLNLLLGVSIVPGSVHQWWWLGLVPVVYIAAITMVSRGEVHGGRPATLYAAALLYLVVIGAVATMSVFHSHTWGAPVLLVGFAAMILPPLFRAMREPAGRNIGKAVKAGVIGLILMDAAWAAAFGAIYVAIGIVVLLPLSLLLAKVFAVT